MFKCGIYTNQSCLASTEVQRSACESFAAKNGFIVLKKRYDDFCNSTSALQELFDDIEACEIDYVLFYTFDCLTTSTLELNKIMNLFEDRGVFFEDVKPVEISIDKGKLCMRPNIKRLKRFADQSFGKVAPSRI